MLLMGSVFGLEAQNNTSSPYSIRGYGEMENSSNAFCRALGGASNGIRSEHVFSFSNPASLGATKLVILDFGFRLDYSHIYSDSASKTGYNGNFNYFSLSFPVYRKPIIKKDTSASARSKTTKLYTEYRSVWNAAFGFMPYSSINSTYSKLKDTTYGLIGNYYSRTGGLTRLFFMNSVNIKPNISLGLNTSFIFGQTRAYDGYYLFDTGVSRATIHENNISMRGFKFDFGIQAERNKDTIYKRDSIVVNGQKILRVSKRPVRFVFGATLDNSAQLNYSIFRQILNKSNYYITAPIDTVILQENKKGKTALPLGYSAGFSVTYNNTWMFTADYRAEQWGSLKSSLYSDSFSNSSQFSFGLAYRPDYNVTNFKKTSGNKRYLPYIEYRFGFRTRNTGYNFLDNAGNINPLKEYGLSFGIGIPKLRTEWDTKYFQVKSMFNITAEYVKRGNIQNGMISENLYRITLGLTLPDVWFRKRKFE